MTSFEVWLPVGAIGLYLFDSILWLYSNELIFQRRGGKWISAAIPAFLLAGRRVCFPNPLTPGTPQFTVRWSESDRRSEQESAAELDEFYRAPLRTRFDNSQAECSRHGLGPRPHVELLPARRHVMVHRPY
jgi:hypothetical protein